MSVQEAQQRIWEAVAREQEALACILEQECRKIIKSADMLETVPNDVDPNDPNHRIEKIIGIQRVVSEVIRATADKERAIAKKLCAVQGYCANSDDGDDDDNCGGSDHHDHHRGC